MARQVPKIELVDQYGKPLNFYEAAKPSPYRKHRDDHRGANSQTREAGRTLRATARHLAQNKDLVRHALNTLVTNIAGANGVTVEPQPRNRDGEIDVDLSRDLLHAYRDWSKRPEVTWRYDWPAVQRLMVLSWLRDGEALAQWLEGSTVGLDHGTRVPFSLELLEADFLPISYNDDNKNIVQGIQRNAWGRRIAYWVHKHHPGNARTFGAVNDLKSVDASRICHLALMDRLHQERGVTVMASIIQRLEDIHDIDESERIAAKVAASMGAYIRKGNADSFDNDYPMTDGAPNNYRELKFQPGMVFDDLAPGEEIGMIDTSRPNPNLDAYLQTHYRAAAGGFGVSYSSFAKRYDGTYSAQRQELVEQWVNYAVMQAEFTSQFVRPAWERFVKMAVASGQVRPGKHIHPESLDDAMFIGPQMPWIDPYKEEMAAQLAEENDHASGPEIIRRRGKNPAEVLEQQAAWKKRKRDAYSDNDDGSALGGSIDGDDMSLAEKLRVSTDAYGIAVRAGVITPQPDDEDYFRDMIGLPDATEAVGDAWLADGGTRKPITLQDTANDKPSPFNEDDEKDEDAEEESE